MLLSHRHFRSYRANDRANISPHGTIKWLSVEHLLMGFVLTEQWKSYIILYLFPRLSMHPEASVKNTFVSDELYINYLSDTQHQFSLKLVWEHDWEREKLYTAQFWPLNNYGFTKTSFTVSIRHCQNEKCGELLFRAYMPLHVNVLTACIVKSPKGVWVTANIVITVAFQTHRKSKCACHNKQTSLYIQILCI